MVLYDDDRQLVRAVGERAVRALANGGSVVLLGSGVQLDATAEWIELSRGPAASPAALDHYITIDADAVADELVAAADPAQRFEQVLSEACTEVDWQSTVVHIFGSLVGALWERGESDIAASIESFGDHMAAEHGASVLCAYPATAVANSHGRDIVQSCHSGVVEVPTLRFAHAGTSCADSGGPGPAQATCARVFPAVVPACRAARHFVRDILQSTRSNDEVIDTIELICSELSANAVRHARSPFTVALECAPTHVRIAVADEGSPVPVERSFPVRTGRGLGIVAALARDWGVEQDERGHAVWAEVARRPGGPGSGGNRGAGDSGAGKRGAGKRGARDVGAGGSRYGDPVEKR